MKSKDMRLSLALYKRTIRSMVWILIPALILASNVSAQNKYGNEWINTSQTYLRIPVTTTGFYKISTEELRLAGIPVDLIPSKSFQMFRRGKELAIETDNNGSGKLGQDGFIHFYGQRNDGALDSMLYVTPSAMPHSYYSLYSDSAAYFLTWRLDGGPGKRFETIKDAITKDTVNYHFAENLDVSTSNFPAGNLYPIGSTYDTGSALTTYDVGEGWTGGEFKNGVVTTLQIYPQNAATEFFDQAEAEILIVGRSPGSHLVDIWLGAPNAPGKQPTTMTVLNYNTVTYRAKLSPADLTADGRVVISIVARNNTGSISLSYSRVRYPQRSILQKNLNQKLLYLNNSASEKTLKFQETENWRFFDCTDKSALKEIIADNASLKIRDYKEIIAVREYLKINSPRTVHFAPIDSVRTDYLIISHGLVRASKDGRGDPVTAYATYRASGAGGNYHPLVINSEEVYDRFNYGEPGPLGIRNLVSWLHKRAALKFVFIIGKSIDPQSARRQADARQLDMIPNAGWPGSDVALTMGIGGAPTYVPLVPIGRVNAATPENVWDYLHKVQAMEAQAVAAPWRKNILHLSGGRSLNELTIFREYVNSFEKKISDSALGARVTTISKKTDDPVEQFPIEVPVNNGVALMTLFGHASLDVSDIDIGMASDAQRKYKNDPFYPAVLVNGCSMGNIYLSIPTLGNDWMLTPEKGSVLFLSHTHNGVVSTLKHYTDSFYEVLADPLFQSKPFGTIQQEAIRRNMLKYPTLTDGITAQQMNLQGDPAITIFPAKLPDYSWNPAILKFSSPSGKPLNARSDSVQVRIGIANYGRFRTENVRLTVKRTKDAVTVSTYQQIIPAMTNLDTLTFTLPNQVVNGGKESWEFVIDPENLLPEENKINNKYLTEFTLPEGGASPILPVADYQTVVKEIELVAQTPTDHLDSQVVFEWDTSNSFTSDANRKETVTAKNFIARTNISISVAPGEKIYWRVYLAGEQSRPSQSRSIIFSPNASPIQSLPEVVALTTQTDLVRIQEGDVFSAEATFNNITKIPFADSVSLRVVHTFPDKTTDVVLRIAPLTANEIRAFRLNFQTLGLPGTHQISVTFNDAKLPEEVYTNNEVTFTYTVVTDQIPPILNVSVDHRQIADGDIVPPQPTIGIQIVDENKFLIRSDTTGIEVWLREDCTGCAEQRISLKSATVKNPSPNDFRLELMLPGKLKNGTYFLRVESTDLSKNAAPAYQIHFQVKDVPMIANAGVSPNPTNYQFRFFLETEGAVAPVKWNITVTDQMGRAIYKTQVIPHLGSNESFWRPTGLTSGIYIYKMELDENTWPRSPQAEKGMSGKLVWVP